MGFSISGFFKEVAHLGAKVGEVLTGAAKVATAVKETWSKLGPQTVVVASQVFYDVIKTATLAESASSQAAGGNFVGAVQLSEQTLSSVKQLVADFKTGEQQVVADFKALEYDFTGH